MYEVKDVFELYFPLNAGKNALIKNCNQSASHSDTATVTLIHQHKICTHNKNTHGSSIQRL